MRSITNETRDPFFLAADEGVLSTQENGKIGRRLRESGKTLYNAGNVLAGLKYLNISMRVLFRVFSSAPRLL
jgi:hypothetical protein